ncbi:MAG: hypothetical protein MI741_06265, partial [Rhodospirillales bacterium]|nr:hypothetical protein [Rhodospirillales bacterium]
TPACSGPLAIGAQGSAMAGGPALKMTCLNAPPRSSGFLLLGKEALSGIASATNVSTPRKPKREAGKVQDPIFLSFHLIVQQSLRLPTPMVP